MNTRSYPLWLTSLLAGLFLLPAISSSHVQAEPPKVGEKFAEFELMDLSDNKHSLKEITKTNKVVLLVLRGYRGISASVHQTGCQLSFQSGRVQSSGSYRSHGLSSRSRLD
ncbi:MAG: hypothetical protein R3C11_18790 [Planctomycetaceae bacterium]